MIRSRTSIQSIALAVALVLVAALAGAETPAAAAGGDGNRFIWPTQGRVTQPYGCTGFSWEPRYGGCRHFHGGIDIANARGTPIRAAASGIIDHVGWDEWSTRNWMVIVDHGHGLVTWYAHMKPKRLAGVRRGLRVRQGEIIGYMSDTGLATGVHLHWSVLRNGAYANPRNYVSGNPYKPGRAGLPTDATACDGIWIAAAPGAVTAVVLDRQDGGGGSDADCATA